MKKALHELKELLCEELDEIAAKKEMNAGDLETLQKLTDTIKNIDKIMILEEDGGYSQAGDWEARGKYMMGGDTYRDGGMSGRRQRRDSRGRYSYDDGKHEIVEQLEVMFDNASDKEREAIRRCIEVLKDMR